MWLALYYGTYYTSHQVKVESGGKVQRSNMCHILQSILQTLLNMEISELKGYKVKEPAQVLVDALHPPF